MQVAFAQFKENLKRARDLGALAANLSAQTTTALDVSDIFRASFVLAVSALDHFVHEIARKGMLEIASQSRAQTDAYNKFPLSLQAATALIAQPGQHGPLDDAIRERHGWLSFQQPDKIADAIRLVCAKDLWKEVANLLNDDAKNVKSRLRLVVDRRNKIAHEADMDPTAPGARWPIDALLVTEAIAALEAISGAIFLVVSTP